MTQQTKCDGSLTTSLEAIAGRAYAMIASAFPVCAFSDEFYFFPQVVQTDKDWKAWDDFSAQRIPVVADILRGHESDLSGLVKGDLCTTMIGLTPSFCCRCCGLCASNLTEVAPTSLTADLPPDHPCCRPCRSAGLIRTAGLGWAGRRGPGFSPARDRVSRQGPRVVSNPRC